MKNGDSNNWRNGARTIRRNLWELLAAGAILLGVTAAFATQAPGGGVPLDGGLARLPVIERILRAPVFPSPLVFVGDQAPDVAESEDLWLAIDVMRVNGPKVGIPALELFVESYPKSAWVPSLRSNLGRYYRNLGRYSLALAYWEAAWEATRLEDAGAGKAVADFTLAHWTRLLASLGRKEVLALLLKENEHRVLDAGPLQQQFNGTKEGYRVMRRNPGVAYRCGTLALHRVAEILQSTSPRLGDVLQTPSPESGFSLSLLKQMADGLQLNLVAVQRSAGQDLVVPSVVHWKLDHYAAITAQEGNRYRVEDPTFEHTIWMDAETINAEASGYFLVPYSKLPSGWRIESPALTDQVRGRGYPSAFDDAYPEDCPNDEDGSEDSDATNTAAQDDPGNPSADCPSCAGPGGDAADCSTCDGADGYAMPVWRVSEPSINLWLVDKPSFYTKANGKRHAVKFVYKQRNSRSNPNAFGFGPSWECNSIDYIPRMSMDPGPILYPVAADGPKQPSLMA